MFPLTPGQQPSFNVQLSSAYTLGINGTVTLTFTPDSGLPDDPNILFQNGTRTLDFTIAAGSTVSSAALQTGTVAGRIDLTTTRLLAAGQSILPSPAPVRSIQIPRSAPVISSVQVVRTSGGFDVQVRGFSTPRQVTQAHVRLHGRGREELADNPSDLAGGQRLHHLVQQHDLGPVRQHVPVHAALHDPRGREFNRFGFRDTHQYSWKLSNGEC